MSFFSDMQTATDVEKDVDTLGGSGFSPLESGLYDATILHAYTGESSRGSKFVTVAYKVGNQEFDETLYITNSNKETFYVSKKDGTKHLLPSYITFESLALLAGNTAVKNLTQSSKVLEIYDFDAGKKVPTKVLVINELLNKPVILGIQQVVEFKRKKVGNDYVDSDETRTYNTINKVFRANDRRTVNEIRAKADAEFIDAWSNKWTGVTLDKTKGKKPTNTNTAPVADMLDDDVF